MIDTDSYCNMSLLELVTLTVGIVS